MKEINTSKFVEFHEMKMPTGEYVKFTLICRRFCKNCIEACDNIRSNFQYEINYKLTRFQQNLFMKKNIICKIFQNYYFILWFK